MRPVAVLHSLAIALMIRAADAVCVHDPCSVGAPLVKDFCPQIHGIDDAYCNLIEWDDVCVGKAIKLGASCPSFRPTSGSCPHPVCTVGAALTSNCDRCAERVTAMDAACGTIEWSQKCVELVEKACDITCGNNFVEHLAFFVQRRQATSGDVSAADATTSTTADATTSTNAVASATTTSTTAVASAATTAAGANPVIIAGSTATATATYRRTTTAAGANPVIVVAGTSSPVVTNVLMTTINGTVLSTTIVLPISEATRQSSSILAFAGVVLATLMVMA